MVNADTVRWSDDSDISSVRRDIYPSRLELVEDLIGDGIYNQTDVGSHGTLAFHEHQPSWEISIRQLTVSYSAC